MALLDKQHVLHLELHSNKNFKVNSIYVFLQIVVILLCNN